MNRSTIFYIIAFLLVAGTARAQITITQTDYQNLMGKSYNINSYETTTGSDLTSLAAQKGANQTFDFTAITSFSETHSGTFKYMSFPASVPGANDTLFANATAILESKETGTGGTSDTTLWTYQQIKSDGLYMAGMVFVSQTDMNGDGITPDTVITGYNPYRLEYKLPLTYGTTWKDTTSILVSDGDTTLFPKTLSGITMTQTYQSDAVVDGYGTLVLPNKTENCLRIKEHELMITNMQGNIYGVPYSQSDTSNSWVITYITKSGDAGAAIILDKNGNPTWGGYNEPTTATPIETPPGQSIARAYSLYQNYPNPFNPSTVISYNLKQDSPVKLQIYNSLGQLVATLADGIQAAGSHKVTFNAAELNSGLYFYRLKAGDFIQTRKMMLIK